MCWLVESTKDLYNFNFDWTLSYFSFYNYSVYSFASLLGIPIEITRSAIGLKICTIAERIKM